MRIAAFRRFVVNAHNMATGICGGKTPKRAAVLAVAGAVGVLVVGALAFSFDLTRLDAEAVGTWVRGLGAGGPLALLALLVAQAVVAPLPSPPLLMAAGFVYGPWVGFGIGWMGLLLGASACFGLARAFGRPFAERFVRPQRLAAVGGVPSWLTAWVLLAPAAGLLGLRVMRARRARAAGPAL